MSFQFGYNPKQAVKDPAPKNLEICYKISDEGTVNADPATTEMKLYLEIKGFKHKVHLVDPATSKNLPTWFRRNNWDGVLPMAKFDKEQYKLGATEIMAGIEEKFRVPLLCSGGPGAFRFRGTTVKDLTLELLKSEEPYDDSNTHWKDLKNEFEELNQYIVQCHNTDGDYLKVKKFSVWDIRLIPALYNMMVALPHFKPGYPGMSNDVGQLRSYVNHAIEDPMFKKLRPTDEQIIKYFEHKLKPSEEEGEE